MDAEKKVINITLTKTLADNVAKICKISGANQSEFIEVAIVTYLLALNFITEAIKPKSEEIDKSKKVN